MLNNTKISTRLMILLVSLLLGLVMIGGKLAKKSAQSANEIDRVTRSLNEKSGNVEAAVQIGLSSLQEVGRVSSLLTEAVSKSSNGVGEIAASVSEQSLASAEIARNVEKIAQMSEDSHTAAETNTHGIVRLEQLTRELQAALGRFRI